MKKTLVFAILAIFVVFCTMTCFASETAQERQGTLKTGYVALFAGVIGVITFAQVGTVYVAVTSAGFLAYSYIQIKDAVECDCLEVYDERDERKYNG